MPSVRLHPLRYNGQMHIHFVCSGNAYRSRLAEAYFKSITRLKNITVSSSGIAAGRIENKYGNGPICWYAMRIMNRRGLIEFMSWHERQTTVDTLKDVDLLVCMHAKHLGFCKELGYAGKAEVWDIPDLNEMPGFIPGTVQGPDTDLNHIKLTDETFDVIRGKADDLARRINDR